MIIREFKCLDCTTLFESSDADPVCPQCTSVERERVFLTPPNINSPNTKRRDTILGELAAEHGLSNMSNAGGAAVKKKPQAGPQAPAFADVSSSPVMGQLARLNGQGDGLSAVLPSIKNRGPTTWTRRQDR